MSNHYHLLLETPEANLVEGMKWFQGAYTQRFNAMFKRRGHLYQGRYKAIPVQASEGSDYFRSVSTYIHLNPFRAGLCGAGHAKPLESHRWSSYPAYIAQNRKRPSWLIRERVLKTWGLKEGRRGTMSGYREMIEGLMEIKADPAAAQRSEIDTQIKRGWFIGAGEFREELQELLNGRTDNDSYRGSQRRDHGIAEAERLLAAGIAELGWSESDMLEARSVQIEKQALAWLIKSRTAVTGKWLAERLHMGHPVNASRALGLFRRNASKEVRALRSRMLKCAG